MSRGTPFCLPELLNGSYRPLGNRSVSDNGRKTTFSSITAIGGCYKFHLRTRTPLSTRYRKQRREGFAGIASRRADSQLRIGPPVRPETHNRLESRPDESATQPLLGSGRSSAKAVLGAGSWITRGYGHRPRCGRRAVHGASPIFWSSATNLGSPRRLSNSGMTFAQTSMVACAEKACSRASSARPFSPSAA